MASDQLPHGTSCHAPSSGDGHRAADTLWFSPASRGHVFALALAGPPPRFFQGDVLPQQLGMEMLLLWGEYHQKHLSVPGHCSAGGAQSGASPAGKERIEVKDKLKLERKLNMPFRRILLALICQFFFHPLPLPMASGAVRASPLAGGGKEVCGSQNFWEEPPTCRGSSWQHRPLQVPFAPTVIF